MKAQKNGCYYRSDFEVITKDAGGFPALYPDTLYICEGEQEVITVQNLDSIITKGITYTTGEQLTFSGTGDFTLTGFTGGCPLSKDISVKSIADPSDSYHQNISWCEDTPLSITLPNDSAGWNFTWSDGSPMRHLTITAAGEYTFEIKSENCTFQSNYTIIEAQDSDCVPEECKISIPNTVTPNGDGWNDELVVITSPECGAVETIRLWDKWGGMVYQGNSSGIEVETWKDISPGTYLVQVDYKDESGTSRIKTGSVLVLK